MMLRFVQRIRDGLDRFSVDGRPGPMAAVVVVIALLVINGVGLVGRVANASERRRAVKRPSVPAAVSMVDTNGGEVAVTNPESPLNGVTLTFPPGAIAQPTPIRVYGTRDGRAGDASAIIRLEPSGLQLATPATLSIPFSQPLDEDPAVIDAYSFSADNPLRAGSSEDSRWQRLSSTVAGDRINVEVPHFSLATTLISDSSGASTEPLYVVLHIPGQFLLEGDLVYSLVHQDGDPAGAFTWIPGHAGMFLGTATATDDLTVNDGDTLVESRPASGVSLGSLSSFDSATDHIFMGARRYPGGLSAAERRDVAAFALAQLGMPYAEVGADPWKTSAFSCVGLTEAAYEAADLDVIPAAYESPVAFPWQQFVRLDPVSEIDVPGGVALEIPVNGVILDATTGYYSTTTATAGATLRTDLGMQFDGGAFSWPSPVAGSYDVEFSTTGMVEGVERTATQTLTINVSGAVGKPTGVSIAVSPSDPIAGTTVVSFSGSQSGGDPATSWEWNFGDGSTASGQNVTHVFSTVGAFRVTLTASNAGGSSSIDRIVSVSSGIPSAAFTWAPTSPGVGETVQFTDESTGAAATLWSWSFGDGSASDFRNPTHAYSSAGSYTVTVLVANSYGFTSASHVVSVGPPTAAFSWSPTTPGVGETVHFLDESTGIATFWSWSFGDGTGVDGQNPTHAYSSGGSYTVTVLVGNTHGFTSASHVVWVGPPRAAFSWTPTSPGVGETVHFTDESTGTAAFWSWSFGDGTGVDGQNPTHAYSSAGSYTVTVLVGNTNGFTSASHVVSVGPPIAAFSWTPTTPDANETVQFTDESTGVATFWSWSFGDGTGSGAQNPTHAYSPPGVYTVTLYAGNTHGFTTASHAVSVGPPKAAFTWSPASPIAGQTVQFTDLSGGGAATLWSWSFGDGFGSDLQNPTHAYSTAGSYTVSLTVGNSLGGSSTSQILVVSSAAKAGAVDPSPNEVAAGGHRAPGRSPCGEVEVGEAVRSCNPDRLVSPSGPP